MILAIRVENYRIFNDKVELSTKANLKIQRLISNTIPVNEISVVKSSAIYGPNNVGKTCLIRAIEDLKNVLLGIPVHFSPNWFSKNPTCKLGITFTDGEKIYNYDFGFTKIDPNIKTSGYTYEKFSEMKQDAYGRLRPETLFFKDTINKKYKFPKDKKIQKFMYLSSTKDILINGVTTGESEVLEQYKEILQRCANNIEVVNLYNFPMDKTLQILKEDNIYKSKVVELIKKADVNIDNYEYVKPNKEITSIELSNEEVPQENSFHRASILEDFFRIMTDYRGKKVPSLIYDSTGTKKIAALASYIIEAIDKGKTLVVDELDSSLHIRITREIVALFNNLINTKGQLIFSVQDVTLLDCRRLFRKDQIRFILKEEGKVYLKSLDEYTAKNGVRAESDLIEQYRKGFLGAVPEPDLISVFLGGGYKW